jgi:putative SOS response-associated peptidase YedK
MCGRFVLCSNVKTIAEEFHLGTTAFYYKPSYNIAPSQNIAVLYYEGENKLMQCRWGFIPSWAHDASIGNRMINARAESIAVKRTFKSAFKNRRCLIPADGFYEWRKVGRIKTPRYIRFKSGRPFSFAGLYNPWVSPEGRKLYTCTIITTGANKLIEPFHNRMPVIIPTDKRSCWLDSTVQDDKSILPLLKPFAAEAMEVYDVSTLVNSPSHDSPHNIKPIESHTNKRA